MIRRIVYLALLVLPTLTFSSINHAPGRVTPAAADRITTGAVRLVHFVPLEEADVKMQCESTQPPRALNMPHPTLAEIPDDARIVVNLIIGTDGEVYSPFVVDGLGTPLDRKVVESVRQWRYRPALCNGVPTDAEVKIELSSR
jgi:hypothetical protein